jgi:hypothetical protein
MAALALWYQHYGRQWQRSWVPSIFRRRRPARYGASEGDANKPAARSIEREIEIIAVSFSKLGCPLVLCGAVYQTRRAFIGCGFRTAAKGHGHERGFKIDAVLVPDCTPAGAVAERSVSRIRLRPIGIVVPISGRRRIDRPSLEGVVHLLDRGRLVDGCVRVGGASRY